MDFDWGLFILKNNIGVVAAVLVITLVFEGTCPVSTLGYFDMIAIRYVLDTTFEPSSLKDFIPIHEQIIPVTFDSSKAQLKA